MTSRILHGAVQHQAWRLVGVGCGVAVQRRPLRPAVSLERKRPPGWCQAGEVGGEVKLCKLPRSGMIRPPLSSAPVCAGQPLQRSQHLPAGRALPPLARLVVAGQR